MDFRLFFCLSRTGYTDFEAIYQAIRSGEVDYGLMNSDIASYQQLDWNGGGILNRDYLAVFSTLAIPTTVMQPYLGIYKDTEYEKLCFGDYVDLRNEAIAKYRKKVEVRLF